MRKSLGRILDLTAELIRVAQIGREVENGTMTIDQARAAISGDVHPAGGSRSETGSTKNHELVA